MNQLLIGTLALCALAALAGSFAFKRDTPIDDENGRAPLTTAVTAAVDGRLLQTPIVTGPVHEFLPESDTTGLLQESLTVDDLLDEIEADFAPEFTPVDRRRLEAELREVIGD